MGDFNLLILIALPLLGAAAVAAFRPKHAYGIALIATLAPCLWFVCLATQFPWKTPGTGFLASQSWFAPLGLEFSLGADTVSMLLIGLTVLLGPICVAASKTAINERVKTYYAWLLVLQGAMTGVFCARDVILFYVFFEFTLVPLYILINLYGSTNRKAAATKFFLFTFTGSLITLAGLVYVAWVHAERAHGHWSFNFDSLTNTARTEMSLQQQTWVFWALLAGFAVKVPLFPVHTWLPLAHTEAPTAGSVVLAGVLLKLGTYGIYRFALALCPMAAVEYAPTLGVLAIIGILYAGLICWVQTDVKKLVAYSSVSHLGFCVLGMFALNSIGLTGSILYMINHGLSTGALFLLIGMIYERYHTRSFKEIGGLAAKMPVWATFMVFFAMASVGLPGLNGFVSEFMCLLGTFQSGGATWTRLGEGQTLPAATFGNLGPYFAFAAGVGMIITAIYLLFMVGAVVFGKLKEPGGSHGHGAHDNGRRGQDGHVAGLPADLTWREIGVLAPLAALCLGLGLYPAPVLHALEQPVDAVAASIQQARERMDEMENPGASASAAVAEPAGAAGEAGR